MKFVLLITIALMLPLVSGNKQPCQKNENNNAYNQFVKKHIVKDDFKRTSKVEWEKYIKEKNLCGIRRLTQSFFEESDQISVANICNGQGHPLIKGARGNLCMSDAKMHVYDVIVDKNCKVTSVKDNNKKVILACDKVGNRCRPVHYEPNKGQKPDMKAKACRP